MVQLSIIEKSPRDVGLYTVLVILGYCIKPNFKPTELSNLVYEFAFS